MMAAACGETYDTSPDAGATALAATFPDASVTKPPSCVYLYPTQYHSGSITTPQTWSGSTVHVVTGDVQIKAAVSIGGCARVEVLGGKSIEVDAGGSLTTAANDAIVPYDATMPWGHLRIAAGAVTLNGTSIGGTSISPAVSLEGGTLNIQSSTISGVAGTGLGVSNGAIDPSSTGLTVTGASGSAVSILANMVGQLPRGSYTGNAHNEILVADSGFGGVVTTSATWKNVGVPYHITGAPTTTLNVGSSTPGSVAVLTLEAGTTLAFDPGTGMRIDSAAVKTGAANGALVAVGQAGSPITFTSAKVPQAPGDWTALYFGGDIDSRTQVTQAVFDFGGGSDMSTFDSCPTPFSSQKAEVRFEGGPTPLTQFITFTTFENSASNGIDLGWQPLSRPAVDFKPTNTFVNVPFCAQTRPSNTTCPRTPVCG